MPESRSHKITAKRISKKLGADYSPGKGVDIKSSRATVEEERLSGMPIFPDRYRLDSVILSVM